ncbi:MAG: efflux RND transporter periplasmic adaptor subunit [Chlorobi bacterium]|nr:efflux RND transporter periplasmic adaptor subunit [Chlorobiota bacterium]
MKNKIIIYAVILIVGIAAGAGGYALIFSNDSTSVLAHEDEDGTLYTCGMHPNIVETEPGNCPICGMKLNPIRNSNKSAAKNNGEKKIIYWRAPMNPNEIYDEPGKSRMGMDLVPVYENEGGASGVVTVDGSVLQSMNVKMEFIKARRLSNKIYTNGVLATDERKEYAVTTKINGWIDKLYINYVGQKVKKGSKLVDIYSPELVAAQQEVLTALDYDGGGGSMLKNAIRKLELFDVTKKEIDNLIKTKKVKKYVTLYAPFDGTVLTKNALEGEMIKAGKEIVKIADLSNLWFYADVYESELKKIYVGSKADIAFTYNPDKIYKGVVSFIYPTVDPVTRTIKVRINLSNAANDLKPSMFGNVEIVGKKGGVLPVVPETAVIRSGKENIVILSLGEGRFKPVDVKLGLYDDGYYQVLSGLRKGDAIVTSGQFMIDSESSLRSAVKLFSSKDAGKLKEEPMSDEEMKNMNKEETKDDATNMEKKDESDSAGEEDIVRKGIIDVESIDANGDGKVFQDVMDWNVISDKEGRCPICGMYLKEVTIEQAKKNLKENGFEYK